MSSTLTRWDPFGELADLRNRFDRMLETLQSGQENAWTPAVDVVRDDGNLVLRADIPGIKPEEVTIEFDNDVLTVSGHHEESTESEEEHFVRRERRYGAFARSMTLPPGVDGNAITATTRDGVLEVTIPLPSEAAKEKVTITPTGS